MQTDNPRFADASCIRTWGCISSVGEKGAVLIGEVRAGPLEVSIAGCTPLPLGLGYLIGNPSNVAVAAGSLTSVHVVCAD